VKNVIIHLHRLFPLIHYNKVRHTVSPLGVRMVQQAEGVGAIEAATATAAPNAEATALLRARAAAALHFT
jgi:hypothetical protein